MRRNRTAGALALTFAVIAFASMGLVPALRGEAKSYASTFETRQSAFGHDLRITADFAGEVQLLGGDLYIDARVGRNVTVFFGNLIIGPAGGVDGDVVVIGGRVTTARADQIAGEIFAPSTVGGAVTNAEGSAAALDSIRQPFSLTGLAVNLALLLLWLVAAVAIVLFAGREVRSSSLEVRAATFNSFTLGLVAFTSFVLTAIVLSYLIPYLVGIPLLALLGLVALVAKIYGLVAVFHAIGSMIVGTPSRESIGRKRWLRSDLFVVLLGLLILGALRMIPVVGTFVWMAASICGVGVSLATRLGRREPWFLAVELEAKG